MKALTPLEQEALKMLLDGKSEWLAVLRKQTCDLQPSSREMTGVGFVTRFSVRSDAPRLTSRPSFRIGDVAAEVNDLKHGAGFLLGVKDGALDSLEGYSYDEPWPKNIHTFRLYYTSNKGRDEDELEKSIKYKAP